MDKNTIYEKWKLYQNYIIIVIVSLVFLLFFPMLDSEVGIVWNFPNTSAGWAVYIITKGLSAALNVIIFHCFTLQAKVNSLSHPNYVAACRILQQIKPDPKYMPRSPRQFMAESYGKKGTTIFLTTLIASVGLTQAILSFDLATMLTHLFTIIFGLIWGIF